MMLFLQRGYISFNHSLNHLFERDGGFPAENFFRFGWIAN
jgi:hypothetical protein